MAAIGSDILKAYRIIIDGGLVAIPTETVYGLGANASNNEAVLKIFAVKNRPKFDPLILHLASFDQITKYVMQVPDTAVQLSKKFWPGPLTMILEKNNLIDPLITAGLNTAAFRVPNHPLTLELLNKLDLPVAAPSANPFGYISPTSPEHVNDQLGDSIDYILDGGPCAVGVESTIISLVSPRPEILRLGGISIEEITNLIGPVTIRSQSSSRPEAPGMLQSHYAPKKKVVLGNIPDLVQHYDLNQVALLTFQKTYPYPVRIQEVLSTKGEVSEAAKNLFHSLRKLEELPISVIIAEKVPDHGLGKAINDRLTRAAVNIDYEKY